MTNPNLTYIAVVLDRSGSMEIVQTATIEGFNTFVTKQKEVPGDARITLALFDHEYNLPYIDLPLKNAPLLDRETYRPRGSTALLDAIGETVDQLGRRLSSMPEGSRPGKVIVVVQTDGLENASRRYSRDTISQKIQHQREKYGWEFVFLGANQDAVLSAESLGMAGHSALTYTADPLSTSKMFSVASSSIGATRSGVTASVSYSHALRNAVTSSAVSKEELEKMIQQANTNTGGTP